MLGTHRLLSLHDLPRGTVCLLETKASLLLGFITGVPASKKIAEKDLKAMDKYKTLIKKVGEKLCIEPAVIAGIISRESHAGKVLKDGWGDNGNGFGLMQVLVDAPLKADKLMSYE